MLLAVQFPLVDLRPFIAVDTHRLPRPRFPLAQPGQFIRSCGRVEHRRKGGVEEWPGEELYCGARSALRFGDRLIDQLRNGSRDRALRSPQPVCVFRRFHSDGVTSSLEVGLRLRSVCSEPYSELTPTEFLKLLREVFNLECKIPLEKAQVKACKLLDAGRHLARHFLRATTKRQGGSVLPFEEWWFKAGEPLALIEHHSAELSSLPPHSIKIEPNSNGDSRLNYCRVEQRGQAVGVWLLEHSWDSWAADKDLLRRLRIHILRLHAEREAMKQVLCEIAGGHLTIEPGTETSDALQEYLNGGIGLLNRQNRFGLNQSVLLDQAMHFSDLVTPGERSTLIAELEKARRNVLNKVRRLTEEKLERAGVVNVIEHAEGMTLKVEVAMKKIEFGGNVTVYGDFNAVTADIIIDAFKKGAGADAPDAMKKAIQDLAVQVAEMAKKMPPEAAENAAKDLQTFANEALSKQPRKKWYEPSSEGLIEAAKTVGEIAAPVVSTVRTILTLLA